MDEPLKVQNFSSVQSLIQTWEIQGNGHPPWYPLSSVSHPSSSWEWEEHEKQKAITVFNLVCFLLVVKPTLIWPKLVLTFPAGRVHIFLSGKMETLAAMCSRTCTVPEIVRVSPFAHVAFYAVAYVIKIPFSLVSRLVVKTGNTLVVVWWYGIDK